MHPLNSLANINAPPSLELPNSIANINAPSEQSC